MTVTKVPVVEGECLPYGPGGTMKRVGCVFALSLFFVSPLLAAPPLASYKVDINQTSVSGVSSGGAMAVQMHVAHSSIMRGVGVIAGVAYDCTNSALLSVEARFARAPDCMNGSSRSIFKEQNDGCCRCRRCYRRSRN